MELNDSTDSKPETRSPLGIDLNEIPSPSFTETLPEPDHPEPDSIDIVRAFHDNPDPATGDPAGLPAVEPESAACSACGGPEAVAGGCGVVVCDGCERGFHLACAGICGPQLNDEWVCAECVSRGVRSKRWPLGVKSKKRILDINASPPSDGDGDGDGEGAEAVQDLWRKHTPGDNSFVGNGFGASLTYSNFLYAGNGFGFQKASGVTTHTVKMGFEDIFRHKQALGRNLNEVDLGLPIGRLRNTNNTAIRFPSRNSSDIFLQALREFISERHGVLEEGWRVELKPSLSSYDLYAVYCAPDGKTFDSMFDVACYLGLMPNYNSVNAEIKCEGATPQERLSLPRKRKSTKVSIANGFSETKEGLISGYCREFGCDGQNVEKCASKSALTKDSDTQSDKKDTSGLDQTNNGLPLQFEDFFALSLGQIDARPSYHDVCMVCPVGYKSCWHDIITGSLFLCEVLDGGESGPIFKIRRHSCSALPIPVGSTILWPKLEQSSSRNNEEGDNGSYYDRDYDNDISIQMIISDPCPPMEKDVLTCLLSSSNETSNVQKLDRSHLEASTISDRSRDPLSNNLVFTDEVSEISVEDHSSSSAWKKMSRKFTELFRQKGNMKFFCKHAGNTMGSPSWDTMIEKSKSYASLAKFVSSSISLTFPSEYQADELETLSDVLTKWLDQDRFGLDAEFVQEMIEALPGIESCSQYVSLKKRSSYSASLTVGNGLLMVKTKGLECGGEKVSDGLFEKSKKPRLVDDRGSPSGRPLCSRLPPALFGDFHQVWELFWRFHEILGLKEPFSVEELEEELINPWFNHSNLLDEFEREIHGAETFSLQKMNGMGGQVVPSCNESYPAAYGENSHAFIQMETGEMKEVLQARLASLTCSRCFGVALTKAHSSLLEVLINELQCKVAPLVDPNFDSGESRPKRGRKKDSDSTVPAKRTKLSLLPINELTWPELSRRYILAVLSMDGNLDSAEITARESGKVFRCLQGDGGVLCGSLTGVAGMEADAHLLAEATKRIFGSLNTENDVLTIEDEGSDLTGGCEKNIVNGSSIPEWAQLLEPVRKLPTNVGTRIRKCVNEALLKGPPEWAKKILEHSISKEVYKGNASGPTKKAVLGLLAELSNKGMAEKSDKGRSKKKSVLSISDIIMKQCRIVLRRAAAADDSKVFCNLLGRKLMNSSDNDDEGLLGSPAMVSRPMDFRTIDLRLAVGAYAGSHEAFLEDVRELWSNLHSAYGDQPDLVELAESLSQNFELLYEKEVLTLLQKFVGYAKSECLNTETKKEIHGIVTSTNEIPKAPWDEGVCKVCGVDKDDDSVLLCDTCDAEYHTYCLNPPLARIPEGNWYCPSCVVNKCMVQDASEHSQGISRRKGKKYQGDVTRGYLEELTHLAAVMGDKEYWEFTVNERTFLLKFLCDELLNSALIRQHLEQCVETTSELQQKLRSSYLEWKALKSREDFLAVRAAKIDMSMPNSVGEVGVKDGVSCGRIEQGKRIGQQQNFCVVSDDLPSIEGEKEGSKLSGSKSANFSDKQFSSNSQLVTPMDTEVQLNNAPAIVDDSAVPSQNCDTSSSLSGLPKEINDSKNEIHCQGKLQESKGREITALPPPPSSDNNGSCLQSDVMGLHAAQHGPSVAENESEAQHLELNTIKSDILRLQDLITSLELQLLKLSVRREFLGSDSSGRMYWISAMPGGNPTVIVDGSFAVQRRRQFLGYEDTAKIGSVMQSSARPYTDAGLELEGSKARCPFLCHSKDAKAIGSPWVCYQTDLEILELIDWLNDHVPKERELKEAICLKLRLQDLQKIKNQDQDEQQSAVSMSSNSDKIAFSTSLFTKAAILLEKKYGSFESEITDTLKKRGKWARVINEEKMYRCWCLEPVWPSRNHCFSCHKTFLTDVEFEEHNDGRCSPGPPTNEKDKEIGDYLIRARNMKPDGTQIDCNVDMNAVENSRMIKFQDDGALCPYNLEEISSKFVTRDSNEELVQEIGLIGSNGIPTFVPSMSPFLSDSTTMLVSQQEIDGRDELKASERLVLSEGKRNVANGGNAGVSDICSRRAVVNEACEIPKTGRPAMLKDRISCLDKHGAELGISQRCVVPQSSLRPLVGKFSHISRQLKINLLDMDAALSEEALRPSKAHLQRRWAWRSFVKSAATIYEMVQATIVLEDMIKTEYLRNEWWYWSSLSAAAKTSTMSSLALRIYSLDAAILYEKSSSNFHPIDNLKPSSVADSTPLSCSDIADKCKVSRRSSKKRKEPEG